VTELWTTRADVGLVDDGGHRAIPWGALRRVIGEGQGTDWVLITGTRWGEAAPSLVARANFEELEATSDVVHRILAEDGQWRMLACPHAGLWQLARVREKLAAGEVLNEERYERLLREILRKRVETVEGPEMQYALALMFLHKDVDPAPMSLEAVCNAYLAMAAATAPLPTVTAMGADFPAHDAVFARLVSAVAKHPELVMSSEPMGGATSWTEYERWLGI